MAQTLTMEQLAEELSLSRRVISAVLNNRCREMRISEATEKRVREHLDAAGYVRSKSAVQLKNGDANDQIGILYCGKYIDLAYLTESLGIFTRAIRERCGLSEITGVDPGRLHDGVSEAIAKGVRKLIWIHANTPQTEFINAAKLFPLFRRMDKVVIYKFDFLYPELQQEYLDHGVELVGFDSEKSYRDAAAIFRQAGHRSVAQNDILAVTNEPLAGNDMLRTAFEDAGLEVLGLHPGPETPEADIPRLITENLIRLHREQGVRAAFLRNDLLAAQVLSRLGEAGLRIPEDIAVIGFSGSRYSEWLPVPLTTFEHPVEEMCRYTMSLLDSENKKARCHIFDNKLVLRKSHGETK